LSAQIKSAYPEAQVEMIPGSGGVFEVHRDGELVFSKKQTGRFPEDGEIV